MTVNSKDIGIPSGTNIALGIGLGMTFVGAAALLISSESASLLPAHVTDTPSRGNPTTFVSLEALTVTQVQSPGLQLTADFQEEMFCKTTGYVSNKTPTFAHKQSQICKSFSEVKDPANKAKIEEMRNILKNVAAAPSF